MKLLTVFGAYPEFIKVATVSRAIKVRGNIEEIIFHTDQHLDAKVSHVLFERLDNLRRHHNVYIAGLAREQYHNSARIYARLHE